MAGTNAVPSTGVGNVPVLLVTFSDRTATQPATAFNTLLFGTGSYSMADYYKEVSYNQYTVSAGPSGIGGWYTASNTHDYYGTNLPNGDDAWPGDLVYEAAAAANAAGFNFAPYDQDGDCYVDNLVVVHQGGGEEFGGAPSTNIWSHSWSITGAQAYGESHFGALTSNSTCAANPAQKVKVNKYTIQPELYGTTARISTMGVFAHEFGHALGLPDLYDTDYTSEGVGNWSLMAGGSWNYSGGDSGNRPAHFDPWSKWRLGWILPRAISCSTSVSLPAVATSSAGFFALLSGGAPYAASGEYFLVENRQKTSFDAGLPGAGLLVWHVDEGRASNNAECYPGGALPCNGTRHYKVALVQADNLWELEKATDRGDAGDPYPGTSGNVTLNAASSPNSNVFAGTADGGAASGASITSISASAATMTATLAAPGPCITAFTPTSGPVGTSVGITGSGFTGATGVRFNGTSAAFTVDSDTSITAPVPAGATTGPISIVAPSGRGGSSSPFTVTTAVAPTVTSFTPTSGGIGTSVAVTGTSFTGATAVRFNGTSAVAFTVNSATSITATVPAGATTGPIGVTTPGGTGTSAGSFTVVPAPTVTSFTPTSGGIGTSVAVTGTSFTGATAVRFNGTSAVAFTINSATSITATVPAGATTGPIGVTTPGGVGTSAGSFTVTGLADLAIAATGPSSAIRGGNLAYTTTVTNNGPAPASSVQVALPTPAGLRFVSNAGACTTAFPCALGTMASGTQRTITATFEVPVDYAPAPIEVSPAVTSGTGDPNPANNTTTVRTVFGTFFTLVPCRVADTRDASSPNGPPALGPGDNRTLVLAGTCGIPAGATALAVNLTVTGATASGNVRLFPADVAMPLVSTINYVAGLTRANNAIVGASADGQVAITAHNASSGEVHLILDVTGYFE